MRVYRGVVSTE